VTKIKGVCHWSDSATLHKRIIDQFIPGYSSAMGFEFTTAQDYDYLLLFSLKSENPVCCPKQNVVGFLQEPPDNRFVDKHLSTHCGVAYVCSDAKYYEDTYSSAPGRMFYHMLGKIGDYANNSSYKKRKKLSVVVSGKRGGGDRGKFYEVRHDVLSAIFKSDLECDIYGHSISTDDNRYMGSPADKADALIDYEYSIAIENGRWDGYISEKFIDCILCNTIPIYLGAPDIDKHFPSAYIELPLDDTAKKLKEIISADNSSMVPQIRAAKAKWIKHYNLFDLVIDSMKR
jgi:Glycosyltransferase family 10 (fucosyltransferase) C-term